MKFALISLLVAGASAGVVDNSQCDSCDAATHICYEGGMGNYCEAIGYCVEDVDCADSTCDTDNNVCNEAPAEESSVTTDAATGMECSMDGYVDLV